MGVAQLEEQRSPKPQVAGSSPATRAKPNRQIPPCKGPACFYEENKQEETQKCHDNASKKRVREHDRAEQT
jgi:hypothetical protein